MLVPSSSFVPVAATVGVTSSAPPVVIPNDPVSSRLPADLSAISVEPLGGLSLSTTVMADAASTSAIIVSAVASDGITLPDSHEGESGTPLEAVSRALSSAVVFESHEGEDHPPLSGESEEEETGQTTGVVGGQTVTSRFSIFCLGLRRPLPVRRLLLQLNEVNE